MRMRRVTILQEYVPAYREPLFRLMKSQGRPRGIQIEIAAGEPNVTQGARADASSDAIDWPLSQREWRLFGRRVVLRKTWHVYRRSDLVIVEQARRNLDVYLAMIVHPGRVATWGHGRDFTHAAGASLRRLQLALTKQGSWFFGYTPASVKAVVDAGFPLTRTTPLWNSTDTSTLKKHLSSITADEVKAFRDGAAHAAVFIGGLDETKRLGFLIDAGRMLAERLPGFTLTICGDGIQRPFLEEVASRHEWLRLVGPVSGRSLALALAASDLLTMPGRVGLVAVDALAAGRPIITTDWPYHGPERDYLTEETCQTTQDSVESFADGVEGLFRDTAKLRRMQESCEQSARELSIELMADRFLSGIEAALSSPVVAGRRRSGLGAR